MKDLLNTAAITILVVASLWLATFLLNLALAPAELDKQRLDRIRELESQFASAEQRRAVSSHLAKMMAEGRRLHRLGSEGTNDAKQWAADTYKLISQLFGAAESEIFLNDAGFPVAIEGFPGDVWLQRRLTRLHDLLSRSDRLLRDNPVDQKCIERLEDAHSTVPQA